MSRRRDSASRQGYSSADAYRALPSAPSASPATPRAAASASDEDALIPPASPAAPSPPMHTPLADSFARARQRTRRPSEPRDAPEPAPKDPAQHEPLAPPRPSFLAGSTDRRSWSSADGSPAPSTDPEPASDSEASVGAGMAGIGARGTRSPPTAALPLYKPSSPPPNATAAAAAAARTRNHHRRRSSMANEVSAGSVSAGGPLFALGAPSEESASASASASVSAASAASSLQHNPFDSPPTSLYGAPSNLQASLGAIGAGAGAAAGGVGAQGARSPPSAYPFPFQSHPGNPDPGTPIPGAATARRASLDSLRRRSGSGAGAAQPATGTGYAQGAGASGYAPLRPVGGSSGDLEDLARPYAPFMEGAPEMRRSGTPTSPMASQSQIYRGSAAAAAAESRGSTVTMRANFLSPASRPTSSVWAPPSYPQLPYQYPPTGSYTHLPGAGTPTGGSTYNYYPDLHAAVRRGKKPMRSTALAAKLTADEKPWIKQKDRAGCCAWWLTFCTMWLGIAGAAVFIYFGYTGVAVLPDSELCLKFEDDFSAGSLDTSTWTADVEMSGFGNGEFQMTMPPGGDQLFLQNGELYIYPTLTSAEIGEGSVLDGYTYPLKGCTTESTNSSACSAKSDNSTGTVIPPVQSARISTISSYSIQYGRVEVRAKLPTGDWLWPAIWMMPVESAYGPWPMSGEIDIMEARGNGISYPAQGSNYVRATLNYGPLNGLMTMLYGWWSRKQSTFAADFHVYQLEWTPEWMRFSVDSRLQAMMNINVKKKSLFDVGKYPATAHNGSATEVPVTNIWATGGNMAPFDKNFYLILDVAAGGTSGWFPDNVGGKPWYDASGTAMREFALAQDTWAQTWPSDQDDRAFRVDYVKMWQLNGYGTC